MVMLFLLLQVFCGFDWLKKMFLLAQSHFSRAAHAGAEPNEDDLNLCQRCICRFQRTVGKYPLHAVLILFCVFFFMYTITVSVSCLNDSHLLVLIQNSWTSNFTAEISSVKM